MENDAIEQKLVALVETMEQIYIKNMNWLSQHDAKLYRELSSSAYEISQDKTKETYSVSMTNSATIDILDKSNNTFLYNCDPFEYGDKKANAINTKKLKKVVFKGTLLGTHISGVIKKFQPKKATICEIDEQIFRCSLYVTDYASLAEITNLKFHINEKCKTKEDDFIIEA